MCGIIGYVGDDEECTAEIDMLLSIANFNVHRGDDGIGVIHQTANGWKITKKHNRLKELTKKAISKDRVMKDTRIGDIQIQAYDTEKYEEEQKKFLDDIEKFYKMKGTKIFLHHRRGTVGSDTLKNLHPIEVNGKFYMHNGTVFGLEPMRKWLEMNTDIKTKTDLDTEIIAIVYQQIQKKVEGDSKKLYETMLKFFPSGWGVLIEFSDQGDITIIKDGSRSLWAYMNEGNGILLVSEPVPECENFDKIILLDDGIFKVSHKMKGEDYTDNCKKALKWWKESNESLENEDPKKCETCNEIKHTVCTFYCTEHPDTNLRNEICFECLVLGEAKNNAKDDQDEWIRQSYASLIGDYEEK